jgi:hypothetical protein
MHFKGKMLHNIMLSSKPVLTAMEPLKCKIMNLSCKD